MKSQTNLKKHFFKGERGFPSIVVTFSGKFISEIRFFYKMPAFIQKSLLTIEEKLLLIELDKDINDYFSGLKVDFGKYKVKIIEGTPFQRKVWRGIRTVPYGQTRSYKWLAQKVGNPLSVRAVGNACGKNPLPIIIPCHRIIASNGSLGGFSGGVKLKRQLLRNEGIVV